jgi:ABC-type lipoprotein release transport system permease subunit
MVANRRFRQNFRGAQSYWRVLSSPFALVGLLATWIPARRAFSINPLDLLREE